uniref:Pilus assembly protein n=1 Tax=Haemonchus placei TaxID=6290 RepID=A0A0N4VWR1_HAEPC
LRHDNIYTNQGRSVSRREPLVISSLHPDFSIRVRISGRRKGTRSALMNRQNECMNAYSNRKHKKRLPVR